MRGLLDTSIFIADEQRRPLAVDRLPDEAAISVVTLAELELGVHLAADDPVRAGRLATLRRVVETYVALEIDDRVASAFAELVAAGRTADRRPKVQDAWIAATARAHDVPLYTQDSNFGAFGGLEVVRV